MYQKMEKHKDFAKALQDFFTEYLARERGSSRHTIKSYRDTFVLLIDYMEKKHKKTPDKIKLEDITKSSALDFLNWLEEENGCSVSTRNSRCVALRSFAHFLMYEYPEMMLQWKQICSIKMKRGQKGQMNYLSIEATKCLLEQIDIGNVQGRRNLTMLSLLYNTGARVQELIDLTPLSIRKEKPYAIELFGKGSKRRLVPLDDDIMNLLVKYMHENHLDVAGVEHHPLFFNVWGEKLTPPGVTYVLKKYFEMAKNEHPELFPDKISPHVMRHTRAMHLLQAGVNLIYIRDILGHVSIQTTEVYARADSKQKREALEKAYAAVGITEPEVKIWESNAKLREYLKSLA